MNDSFGGGGGFNTSSLGAGTGGGTENKSEGVLPMVINQILESSITGLQLYGYKYSMVAFAGIVRHIEHSSTKITYRMEDHTGQVDAHLWLEEGDTPNAPSILSHGYAYVIGTVRNHGGTKAIMIFKIEQLVSPNDVTTHLLEVLHARYKAEDMAKKSGQYAGGDGQYDGSGVGSSSSRGGFMETEGPGGTLELNGKQLAVYKAIKAHVSSIGISKRELQAKFGHVSASELTNITDYMAQEGLIYTSIDSDHYLCVE